MVDDPTGALLTAGSLLFCVTSFALLLGAPLALARALWRWALPRPSKASHSDTEWPLDAAPPHPSDSVDPPAPGPSPFTCSTAAPVCPLTLCLGSWRHELPAHEAFTRAGDARPPHSAQLKVRGVVLRALGAVYLAAFLIVALQARPLIGAHGLSPADRPLGVLEGLGLDRTLELLGWIGVMLALVQTAGLCDSPFVAAALWGLYWYFYRIAVTADNFFHYGWDFQILETGFLAIFLTPPFCPEGQPASMTLWVFRWLSFRLMLGAGRSKIMAREPCWQWDHLDCMAFHYETTGSPSPLGWLLHHMPIWFHSAGVLTNHFVELVLPWGFLVPIRCVRLAAALMSVLFMATIAVSGNYAFLNHLTMVPLLVCLDDRFLDLLLPKAVTSRLAPGPPPQCGTLRRAFAIVASVALTILIGTKSFHVDGRGRSPMRNLFGRHPWLQTFDSLCLVNAYGVFGSITKKRYEMVLKYTHDNFTAIRSPGDPGIQWHDLMFKCKPDTPTKIPCVITPYHYRLDWETWIYVTARGEHYGPAVPDFVERLIQRLLRADRSMAALLRTPASELFAEDRPPSAIAAEFFLYRYSTAGALVSRREWWQRIPVPGREVFLQSDAEPRAPHAPREALPNRDWALMCASCGVVAGLALASGPKPPGSKDNAMRLLRGPGLVGAHLLCWGLAFLCTWATVRASVLTVCWPLGCMFAPGMAGAWARWRVSAASSNVCLHYLSAGLAVVLLCTCV